MRWKLSGHVLLVTSFEIKSETRSKIVMISQLWHCHFYFYIMDTFAARCCDIVVFQSPRSPQIKHVISFVRREFFHLLDNISLSRISKCGDRKHFKFGYILFAISWSFSAWTRFFFFFFLIFQNQSAAGNKKEKPKSFINFKYVAHILLKCYEISSQLKVEMIRWEQNVIYNCDFEPLMAEHRLSDK